ncbi:1-deoxy-D-xylulose 5-phosphate reductoisomerase [Striga asiatica]|uniref:1-deoxy-D-xylulose 5-phosphate reductoisomerase n=1 Tax=Striga asiatica TaxID=4170 RepID=A0A5A7Q5C3_STRAF|nr:1-deoxy-D-xylulose 5-phosphate reductoisomerase [Striga asiatica]
MEPARRCNGGSRLPECVRAERRLSMTCVDLIGKVPDRGFLDGARLRLAADQKARGWGLSGWLERWQLNRRSLVEEGSSGGAGAEVAARRWSYLPENRVALAHHLCLPLPQGRCQWLLQSKNGTPSPGSRQMHRKFAKTWW